MYDTFLHVTYIYQGSGWVRALGIGLGLEIMDNVFGEEKIICAKVRC